VGITGLGGYLEAFKRKYPGVISPDGQFNATMAHLYRDKFLDKLLSMPGLNRPDGRVDIRELEMYLELLAEPPVPGMPIRPRSSSP
jgi:hypothetical protein